MAMPKDELIAKLIMTREPDLEGFFETRALRRQG